MWKISDIQQQCGPSLGLNVLMIAVVQPEITLLLFFPLRYHCAHVHIHITYSAVYTSLLVSLLTPLRQLRTFSGT